MTKPLFQISYFGSLPALLEVAEAEAAYWQIFSEKAKPDDSIITNRQKSIFG